MKNKNTRTEKQQFVDRFNVLTRTRNTWTAWSDFIHVTACAISNSVDISQFDIREERYKNIICQYRPDEAGIFAELFAITVSALSNNPRQDFLGERLMVDLKLGNARTGQFYTPYNIGEFMAALQFTDHKTQQSEYITVNDCCCGAGC